jgi:vitamin B12 transporter
MIMQKTSLAIAVASLISYTSFSHASSPVTHETMIVTANRFEQKLDSTTAAVEVISKQEIEAIQAKNVLDVLRRLPGIQASSNGGFGQSQDFFIRGTNSNHVLFLIDGVRFGSATTGTAVISAIPLVGIERIEYLRGSRAAVYGSDAVGGVINIITDNSRSESKVAGSVGSDQFRQAKAFTAGDVNQDLHASLGYEFLSTDGYSVLDATGSEDDDGYISRNLTANAQYDLSDHWQANVLAMGHTGFVEYDNIYGGDDSNDEQLYNIASHLTYRDSVMTSRFTAALNQDSSTYTGSGDVFQTDRQNVAWDSQYTANPNMTLGGGVDWYRDDVSKSTTDYDETARDNLAVYLTGYYNHDRFDVESALRHDDNQRYGDNTTWQLGAGYHLTDEYRLVSNVGTAFHAPTFNQLYYPSYGNADLQPEESTNYEVAIEAGFSLADVRLAAYRNEVDNLISSDPTTYLPVNYGEVRIDGLELTAQFDTGVVTHSLSYDYTDAEDQATGNQLRRRAKQSGKWNVAYSMDSWDLSASYLYQGKRFENAANTSVLSAYSLIDVAAAYSFGNGLKLGGKISNLFDKDYETASDYNTPDRKYYLDASYQF